MGRKCRILSIFLIAVFVACSAVCVTLAVSKNIKRREIYATSITFNSPRSMDLYIDNSLIISNDIVTICPNNCTVNPTFYLSTRDDLDVREEMDGQTFKFNTTGSYVITCEIASSKYGYKKSDYITINVIDAPVKDETPMYIRRSENVISPIQGDDIELNNMLDIICPNNANVEILVNDKLKLIDGCIQTVNSGMGEVSVRIDYLHLTVCFKTSFYITPKADPNKIALKLQVDDGDGVSSNVIIKGLEYNFAVDYVLENSAVQEINCWANSDVVEVVSAYAPTIILKPLKVGEAVVYVSPKGFDDVVFEITVTVQA